MKVILLLGLVVAVATASHPPPGLPFGEDCDYEKLQICVQPLEELSQTAMSMMGSGLMPGQIPTEKDVERGIKMLERMCPMLEDSVECMRNAQCHSPQFDALEYLCGDGIRELEENMECLVDPELNEEMMVCTKPLMEYMYRRRDLGDVCVTIVSAVECFKNALRRLCPGLECFFGHLFRMMEPMLHQIGCQIDLGGEDMSGEHPHHGSGESNEWHPGSHGSHGSHEGRHGKDEKKGLRCWGYVAVGAGVLILIIAAVVAVSCYARHQKQRRIRAAAQNVENPTYTTAAAIISSEKPPLDGPIVYAGMPQGGEEKVAGEAGLKGMVLAPPEYTTSPPPAQAPEYMATPAGGEVVPPSAPAKE